MNKLKQQFLEVSDALALGNPAIIEKDYWVIAFFSLIIIFPVARIVATALNERSKVKITNKLQHKQLVDVF